MICGGIKTLVAKCADSTGRAFQASQQIQALETGGGPHATLLLWRNERTQLGIAAVVVAAVGQLLLLLQAAGRGVATGHGGIRASGHRRCRHDSVALGAGPASAVVTAALGAVCLAGRVEHGDSLRA